VHPTNAPSPSSAPSNIARTVLSDGRSGYAYRPQLSYIDPNKTLWLVNADGSGRTKLLEGCSGIGSAKQGDVVTGGIVWSPDGGRVACWREDLSVLAGRADGSASTMPFAAGECEAGPRWAPGGELLACDVKGSVSVRDPGGKERVALKVDVRGEWAWSPSGRALLIQIPPRNNRVAYAVVDIDGKVLTEFADAYAGIAEIAWTRDGSKIAYPGIDGIVVVDLSKGAQRQVFKAPTDFQLGVGSRTDWVLGDSSVFVRTFAGAVLVDVASGAVNVLSDPSYGASRVAPDGQRGAAAVVTGMVRTAMIFDLPAGGMREVSGSRFTLPEPLVPGAEFVFRGDSTAFCWTPLASNEPPVFCAGTDGTGLRAVPGGMVQVEPDVLGRGDSTVLWQGFSPDLTKLAFTTPGLSSPSAAQMVHVVNLDGSMALDLGPTLGVLTYAWRPDGVYRAPARIY
jgi:hypothetical protein